MPPPYVRAGGASSRTRAILRIALTGDAERAHRGHNRGVSLQRILARRDGPLLLALALTLAGLAEAPLHGASYDVPALMVTSLLTTLPLALLRSHPRWTAWIVVALVLWALWARLGPTLAAVAALLIVAYVVANRYRRRASVLMD